MADFVGANDPQFASIYANAGTPAAPGTVGAAPDAGPAGPVAGPVGSGPQAPIDPAAGAQGIQDWWQAVDQRLLAGEAPYGVTGGRPVANDAGPEASLPGPIYAQTVGASALTPAQAQAARFNTPQFGEWARAQDLNTLYDTVNNMANSRRFNAFAGDPADLDAAINLAIDIITAKQNQATGALPGHPGYVTREQLVDRMGTFKSTVGNQPAVAGVQPSLYPMQTQAPQYGGGPAPVDEARRAQLTKAIAADKQYAANLAKTDPAGSKKYLDRIAGYQAELDRGNSVAPQSSPGQMGYFPPPGTPIGTLAGPDGKYPAPPQAGNPNSSQYSPTPGYYGAPAPAPGAVTQAPAAAPQPAAPQALAQPATIQPAINYAQAATNLQQTVVPGAQPVVAPAPAVTAGSTGNAATDAWMAARSAKLAQGR